MFDNHTTGRALIGANALFCLGLAVVAGIFGWGVAANGGPATAVALISAAAAASAVMAALNLTAVIALREAAEAKAAQPARRTRKRRQAKRKATGKAKAPRAPKPVRQPISDPDIAVMVEKVEAAKARLRTTRPNLH